MGYNFTFFQVMTSYDGKVRGFGFVSFEEPEAAQRVGSLLFARNLYIYIYLHWNLCFGCKMV